MLYGALKHISTVENPTLNEEGGEKVYEHVSVLCRAAMLLGAFLFFYRWVPQFSLLRVLSTIHSLLLGSPSHGTFRRAQRTVLLTAIITRFFFLGSIYCKSVRQPKAHKANNPTRKSRDFFIFPCVALGVCFSVEFFVVVLVSVVYLNRRNGRWGESVRVFVLSISSSRKMESFSWAICCSVYIVVLAWLLQLVGNPQLQPISRFSHSVFMKVFTLLPPGLAFPCCFAQMHVRPDRFVLAWICLNNTAKHYYQSVTYITAAADEMKHDEVGNQARATEHAHRTKCA